MFGYKSPAFGQLLIELLLKHISKVSSELGGSFSDLNLIRLMRLQVVALANQCLKLQRGKLSGLLVSKYMTVLFFVLYSFIPVVVFAA